MKTIVVVSFDAGKIPGGADAILGPSQCGPDVAKRKEYTIDNYFEQRTGTDVKLTLDSNDERLPKVIALLAEHGNDPWINYDDVYTEDELQAAPLLVLRPWGNVQALGGPRMGTSYDMSNACPKCGTGAQQTSGMIIDSEDLRRIEKQRIASTFYQDILLHDVDVERLVAAQVTGALFWTVHSKTKGGKVTELRRQQIFAQHVMPPLAPSTLLDRRGECSTCHRGGMTTLLNQPVRFVYRRKDLANIQDVNLTWEWMGQIADFTGDVSKALFASPCMLITPKVMNLLRATNKKDAKYQGAYFSPIRVEESEPQPSRPAV